MKGEDTVSRDEILKILRALKEEIGRDYKAEVAGIFGSYARNEEDQDSDLDVLVDFEEGATLYDLVGLAQFLEDTLGCRVDLVSKRALRKEIEPYVIKDLVTV